MSVYGFAFDQISSKCPIITVNPGSLPAGIIGTSYSQVISATGGTAPYVYTITSGVLPTSLSLNTGTGAITGTPTIAGRYIFTVTATDTLGCTGDHGYNINISVPCSSLTITLTPASFSSGNTGTLYTNSISASGGNGPYTYAVSFGSLPLGLSLDSSTGIISGIPESTISNLFVITATDINGCTKTGEYKITIIQSPAIAIPPYRSNNPTQQDQTVRLQKFLCCLGDKGAKLANKLRISEDCQCEINTFELLVMYFNTLVCYNPQATYNCLTQLQIDAIWDDISKKCGICFAPYGAEYKVFNCGFLLTEEQGHLLLEEGGRFLLNCGNPSPPILDGIGYMYIDNSQTPHFIIS